MTKELPKAYDFKSTESRIYAMWEAGGYFKPHNDPNKPDFDPNVEPFVIAIPPPNVTGELHIGHAMFVSIEDLMIRYHRMKGYSTLWIPGSDHAGIATQLMVERDILKNDEVTREEMGREKFIERTWEWKHKYGGMIQNQIRRLGASCDWDRERFTLDDGLSEAVREAFVRLYEKGLIYRGPRLINWSPGLKTAVSDLEVEYFDEDATLYYFKYMLKDSDPATGAGEYIPVATIRPETILGDTAVAVHPEDERYQKFIGKTAIVPILGREIPVIADEYVSMDFGTGALKITPGHDINDYEISQRHNLPIISVLDKQAKVNENGGPYEGQDRFDARKNIWADMKEAGLVIKSEPYQTTIPRSQRGGEIIEPMISEQWFVKIDTLAEAALDAVKDGRIKIVPERFEKIYYNWMENIKDWCISRQLWWGHRIPVWYCPDGHMTCTREDPTECAQCGSTELRQDEDVLDTWFSSGLWPFSTLGWPDETPDLKYFYPTSYMETGYDILFFWVARMIMLGLEFTDVAPFHTVYLHGLVRDEIGRKISKTLGNVVDPLLLMDEFGTDALRFTMLVGSTPGNDTNVGPKKTEANRNFANKIWNIGRFVLSTLPDDFDRASYQYDPDKLSLADQWIFSRLHQVISDCTRFMENFEYGQAGFTVYEFLWNEFADWYVEYAKVIFAGDNESDKTRTRAILVHVLDMVLRLLHPFVPFVTEELWGYIPKMPNAPTALIVAKWPEPGLDPFEGAITNFSSVQEIIRSIRNIRAEKNVKPSVKFKPIFVTDEDFDLIQENSFLISFSTGTIQPDIFRHLDNKPNNHIGLVSGSTDIYLPLADMVDLSEEKVRLEKELKEAESQIERLEKLLSSDFANKAPAPVVQKERDKLVGYKETAEKIKAQLG